MDHGLALLLNKELEWAYYLNVNHTLLLLLNLVFTKDYLADNGHLHLPTLLGWVDHIIRVLLVSVGKVHVCYR